MGLIIFKDTETTGLPDWKTPSGGENQPHLVQLGAILVDEETREVKEELDVIIKPDGWTWDDSAESEDKAFEAHQITMEKAMDEGISEKEAVQRYIKMWGQSILRICHNSTFDNRIIRIALLRYFTRALAEAYKTAPYFCTMVKGKVITKIPAPANARRYGPYKSPKLIELYKFLFNEEFEDQHNAMADTKACMRCYFGMLDHSKAEVESALAQAAAEA